MASAGRLRRLIVIFRLISSEISSQGCAHIFTRHEVRMMQGNAHRGYTRTVRVAAIQMASENGCVEANLAHATSLIEQASKEGAQLVLLPEFMPTGYLLAEGIWEAAEPADGATVAWLKDKSKRLGIWLGTSFLEADVEGMGRLHYALSSTRKSRARSVSRPG